MKRSIVAIPTVNALEGKKKKEKMSESAAASLRFASLQSAITYFV